MVLIIVLCPHCQSAHTMKGGKTKAGIQRYQRLFGRRESKTGIGKSNGLFHRPLLPPPATCPHRRTQAGRVGGRAPAPGGAGLRLPGGG